MTSCETCRSKVEQLRYVTTQLKVTQRPPVPPQMREQIMKRVRQESYTVQRLVPVQSKHRLSRRRLRRLSVLAAAGLAFLTVSTAMISSYQEAERLAVRKPNNQSRRNSPQQGKIAEKGDSLKIDIIIPDDKV